MPWQLRPSSYSNHVFLELVHASWFSILDLRAGFHQTRLKPGEEYKSTFSTHEGHLHLDYQAALQHSKELRIQLWNHCWESVSSFSLTISCFTAPVVRNTWSICVLSSLSCKKISGKLSYLNAPLLSKKSLTWATSTVLKVWQQIHPRLKQWFLGPYLQMSRSFIAFLAWLLLSSFCPQLRSHL